MVLPALSEKTDRQCAAVGEPTGAAALQPAMTPSSRLTSMLLCLAAVQGAPAQSADPLQSPACRQALTALSAQEARDRGAGAAAGAAAKPALDSARRRAASACLTRRDDGPAVASRSAQPPPTVPPVAALPRVPAPAAATPQRPLPATPPPLTITGCDAVGCWSSDGTRLQRIGADLLGPRGFCITTAGVLSCP